jgi:hypothetical protein
MLDVLTRVAFVEWKTAHGPAVRRKFVTVLVRG